MSEKGDLPYRILVVDDDKLLRDVVEAHLIDAGYAVVTAANGDSAMTRASEQWFDMAIIDVCMPKMSGIELAWRLREDYGIPAILLSVATNRQTVDAAVSEGALGYLAKPIDPNQLLPSLQIALARARDLRALEDANNRLEVTLTSGREVSTAVGILMERLGFTEQDAHDCLNSYAQERDEDVERVAHDLVTAENLVNQVGRGSHARPSAPGSEK